MTLFVKNTDTAIQGVKATADVIWEVSGLADDGLPILGEVSLMQETPEMEIRDNEIMFVTAEGDTYPGSLIEDRREDGSVQSMRSMPRARPVTKTIALHWRQAVAARKTRASLAAWIEGLTDREYLALHGLYLRARDWRINQAHEGDWQITEHYESGHTQEDGSGGVWAIVGRDRDALEQEALGQIAAHYEVEE